MAAGNYVGRVGGLAVALGIGTALVTGWSACPAWADGGSAASASSSSASSHPAKKTKKVEHRISHTKSETKHTKSENKSEAKSETKADVKAGTKAVTTTEAKSVAATNSKPATVTKVGKVETKAGARAEKHAAAQKESEPASTAAATATAATTAATATAAATQEAATSIPQAAMQVVAMSRTTIVAAAQTVTDPALPDSATTALVALAAVREERRTMTAKAAAAAAAQSVSATAVAATDTPTTTAAADSTPNVLLIGVDGTNLSRILANPDNVNFFALMQDGTTAASSIVGHTTISNPSWTAILTGLWGETTGVINNIFNPAVYDRWPTVFNQLEALNPNIETTAIADWDVISAIAASGSIGADHVTNITRIAGDSNWSLTDDAVGDATEAAIAAANSNTANFIFSYFVGVDENGHAHGGASAQYADAVTNVDRNIGEIMSAVNSWEAATGEQWTVIVVTDHGHQASQGFGHGFQSPNETSTFVIADNPDLFASGAVNTAYSIVDVTPTVLTLFGGTPLRSDGVSLTALGEHTLTPINNDTALRGTLQDLISKNGYPNIGTDLALGLRTIAATVPYAVDLATNTITAQLSSIGAQDIFLISPVAQLLILPVKIVGNLTYAATNIIAQIIARLTGVTGASIFPLFVPELPPLIGTADDPTSLTSVSVCTVPGACVVA